VAGQVTEADRVTFARRIAKLDLPATVGLFRKALQKENSRLKKVVVDQVLDMEILREAAQGNW